MRNSRANSYTFCVHVDTAQDAACGEAARARKKNISRQKRYDRRSTPPRPEDGEIARGVVRRWRELRWALHGSGPDQRLGARTHSSVWSLECSNERHSFRVCEKRDPRASIERAAALGKRRKARLGDRARAAYVRRRRGKKGPFGVKGAFHT